MKPRLFFILLISMLAPALHAAQKPNIIVILADDLGYGDTSCYNPQSKVKTPNIDRLAAEGMRFTDAHSASTVCTPSRYSLMTGQMAFRIPRGGTVFTGAGGPSLIAPGRLTLPEMLRRGGYSTACVGKWHIGMTFFDKDGKPINNGGVDRIPLIDYSHRIEGGPLDHGFDSFFGTACCSGTDWLYAFIDGDRIPVPPTRKIDREKLPKHPYSEDCREGYIADNYPMKDLDMIYLEKSRAFLREHVGKDPDKPFFLYHAANAVHLPSFAAEQFEGASHAGPHGDFIHELDHIVGELMKIVGELGIADNTLVLLSSDNGPEFETVVAMRKDHDHDGARPWRGMKRDQWEGGHRVPFIVRWPAKIKPATTSTQPTSLTDVMATLAAVTGSELPVDAAEDSFNMLPALLDTAAAPIRPYMLQQAFGLQPFLSIRRGKWKYLDHTGSGGNRYETTPALKPYILPDHAPGAPGQLYDLESDPGETKNLYFEHPEIVKELKSLLEQSKASGRSRP